MRQKKDFFNCVRLYAMGIWLMSLLCISVSWGSSATQLESVIGENNVYFFSYNTFGQISGAQWPEYDPHSGILTSTVETYYESSFEQGDYEYPPHQDWWQYGVTITDTLPVVYTSTVVGDWRPITATLYQDKFGGQLDFNIQYVAVPNWQGGTKAYPRWFTGTHDGRYGDKFITTTAGVSHELLPFEYADSMFTYLTHWEESIDDGAVIYSGTNTIRYETGRGPCEYPPHYITEWWREKSSVRGDPFIQAQIGRASYPYTLCGETSPVVQVEFPQVVPSSVLTTTYGVEGEFAPFLYDSVNTFGPDGLPLNLKLHRDNPTDKAITGIDVLSSDTMVARYVFSYDEQNVVQMVEHFTEGDDWITYTYSYEPTQYGWTQEISNVHVNRGDGLTTFALVNFADEVTTLVAGVSKLDTFIYNSGSSLPQAVISNYGNYRQYLRRPYSPPWGYLYLPKYNPLLTIFGYDSDGRLMVLFTVKLYMGLWSDSQFEGLKLFQYREDSKDNRLLAMLTTDPFWNAGSVFLFFHDRLGQADAIWDLMGEGLIYRHFGYYEQGGKDGGRPVPLVQRNARAKQYSFQDLLPLGDYEEPIPTPYEWLFEPPPDGWNYRTAMPPPDIPAWDHATSAQVIAPGAIGTIAPVNETTDHYGSWDNYSGDPNIPAISWIDNSVWWAIFTLSTDKSDPNTVPSIRLRFAHNQMKATSYIQVLPGGWLPIAERGVSTTDYKLYLRPPIVDNGFFLAFDLIDFGQPFGVPCDGTVYLEEVVVDRLDLTDSSFDDYWTTVTTYSAPDLHSWTHSTAGVDFLTDVSGYSQPSDGLEQNTTMLLTRAFGAWTSPSGEVDLITDQFYRAIWTLGCEDSSLGGAERVRMHTQDFRYSSYMVIDRDADPANSALPPSGGKDYYIYAEFPGSPTVDKLLLAWDLYDFDPGAGGWAKLTDVVVNRRDLP